MKQESNTARHRRRHGIITPSHYYGVACPYCGAGVMEPCFQRSVFYRQKGKRWAVPHLQRVKATRQLAEEQNAERQRSADRVDGFDRDDLGESED